MTIKNMPQRVVRFTLFGLLAAAAVALPQRPVAAQAQRVPVFEVDAAWPKLPNNWVVGTVSSVAVDRRDHIWVLHRPRSVPENLKSRSAPPVLEFDADGRYLNAWGGDAAGYEWPTNEHGITVDYKDNVWIGGTGVTSGPMPKTDDMLLKFTSQGKFLLQIGHRGQSTGNADTKNLKKPADVFVYAKTNEVFVADGYGNRRVIVFDADTGAFKRMWGAFGKPPDTRPPTPSGRLNGEGGPQSASQSPVAGGDGPPEFSIRVHGVKISNDGLVYVADRENSRIQVFTPDGKYVTQTFINLAKTPRGTGTANGVAFSQDPQQQFLYVVDLGNSHILVLERKTLKVLYQFGAESAKPGDFQGPHFLATDSKGNLYTAETSPGNRAQKFVFKGLSPTLPPNALTAAQLSASK